MLHATACRWCFFFNDTATTEIYTLSDTLSLHDALPICPRRDRRGARRRCRGPPTACRWRSEEHTSELQSPLNISYAVFCLKKKKHRLPAPHRGGDLRAPEGRRRYGDLHQGRVPRRGAQCLHQAEGFFFFNDPAHTEIYTLSDTLSLHDALPI